MKKWLKCCATVCLLVLVIFCLYKYNNQQENGNNNDTQQIAQKNNIFRVDKIIAYSSANAKKNENNQRADWELSVYQFTDLAIYVQIKTTENKEESDIKAISIENMKVVQNPKLGETSFYARKLKDLGKSENIGNKLDSSLAFEIIDEQEEVEKHEYPFKKDGSIPLILGYINNDIRKSYIITDTMLPLVFDGSILERTSVPVTSIQSKIEFTIKIVNALQEEFIATVELDLPINEEIYKGNQTVTIEEGQNFKMI